jgi:PAS domain S-box-containing protein
VVIRGDELIIRRKDRQIRHVEFSIYNLFDETRQEPYQLVQGMDVTSLRKITQDYNRINQELEERVRKRTRELEESQAQLQMALEGAKEGLWMIDFVNGKMNFSFHSARMLGYELDDLGITSTKWDRITHPDDWPRVEKALNDHFAGLTPFYEQQYRARTKDGQWKWILGHGRVTQRDDKGNPIQAIGTHVDINNLKTTEIQLKKSEQKFKMLVENAPFGLLILNQSREIEYFNPQFQKLFGYTSEDLPDLDSWLTRAYPELQYREAMKIIWQSIFDRSQKKMGLELAEKTLSHEFTVRCKDGTEKIIKFNHVPLKSSKHLVSYEDVTARIQAEQILKKHEKALETKNRELAEMNNALRVLLKRIEKDKSDMEENVLANIKDLVIPYIESLENTRLTSHQKSFVEILKSNLTDITSPFSRKFSTSHLYMTPREIQVANLIREGKSTKEISELLSSSLSAIQFHRHNIRKKLGLLEKKINLQSFLQSINYRNDREKQWP